MAGSAPPLPAPWLKVSIAGAAALFVGMGLGRFSYTPMVPALVAASPEAGGLPAAEAGYVAAANLAGFLVGISGSLAARRKWGSAGALRIAVGLSLLALTASIAPWGFAWLMAWRGLLGMTVGVIMVIAASMVTRSAPAEKLGIATGIFFCGVGASIFVTALVVPPLLELGLWQAWTGLAVAAAVATVVLFWAVSDAPADPPSSASDAIPAQFSRKIYLLMAGHFCFMVGLVPHTVYWVDYLVRGLGHDFQTGGFHWALFGAGAIAGTYFWGWLADRIGFGIGLVLVFASLGLATALPVVVTATWALVASSLIVGAQPGCTALMSGRASQIVGAEVMPAAWRKMTLAAAIGQGMASYAIVTLFEWTDSYTLVFLIGGGAFTTGAAVSLALIRETRA